MTKYYIGKFKHGLRNGRGILYYKNGKIQYEGDWINDTAEGFGKYINENGDYYLGEWKNGSKNGKGKICLSNGIVIFNGNFINNKAELTCILS